MTQSDREPVQKKEKKREKERDKTKPEAQSSMLLGRLVLVDSGYHIFRRVLSEHPLIGKHPRSLIESIQCTEILHYC